MRLINFSRNNLLLIVFLTFCSVKANAQFDTLYAIKYPAKIGFSIFQSKPSYKIDITQKFSVDTLGLSKISYSTLTKNITGFGFFMIRSLVCRI